MAVGSLTDAVGLRGGETTHSWDADDVLLYAVAVGARPETDLDLLYEGRGPKVLPTFVASMGFAGASLITELPGVDLTRIVDSGQSVTVHRPIPPCATVALRSEVAAVWDKGSSAVIVIETTGCDDEGPMFTSGVTFIAGGAGGFGGDRGPSKETAPGRAPDVVVNDATHIEQAALYRLTGDRHPVHIDPETARAVGFEHPVLHGLCTFGFVGRAVLNGLCGGEPGGLGRFEARFTGFVQPGEGLETSLWRVGEGRAFAEVKTPDGRVVANASAALDSRA